MKTTTLIRKDLNDIKFTIVATPSTHHVGFEIYDHESYDFCGNPCFHRKGAHTSPDTVERIEEAEPYISGYVKWDGCSNWMFEEQVQGTMLHGCDKNDIQRYGVVLGECWDMAKDILGDQWLG